MNEETQTWERQTEETARAYAAFCLYRNMGTARSLRRVAQELSKSIPLIKRWNERHDWQQRVAQYDAYLEHKTREEKEAEHFKELEEYRKRQRQLAVATIQSAIGLLGRANERLKDLKPEEIGVNALPAFYRAAAAVAEAASNSEAQALAVEELLRALDVDTDHRA